MYVYPFNIGNQIYLLDRDERRVGKYKNIGYIPEVIRVSHDVRRITMTKIEERNDTKRNDAISRFSEEDNDILLEEWLGKNINIKI
jgi:hypothetical protein